MRQKIIAFLKILKLETIIWVGGLLFLAINNPIGHDHFTICPIKNLGFSFCPGCGLGESISYIFRLQIIESFNSHPLGIIAFILIINRIVNLLLKSLRNYEIYLSKIKGELSNG